jgi:hypothetical protein
MLLFLVNQKRWHSVGLKVGKGAKKYVRKIKPVELDPAKILASSEQFRAMITDMHENLGLQPTTPGLAQAIYVEQKLRYQAAADGSAAYVAQSILTGTAEPRVIKQTGYEQALMHYMICYIEKLATEVEDPWRLRDGVKYALAWAMRPDVDPATAIAVTQFALTKPPEDMLREIEAMPEYKAYMDYYGLILREIPRIKGK